ncbi:hypothetical protein A1O3_03131 [Capronia epimyces CBS 606.96]|uniref:Uncharacterized protein n=1 Tax=Capronia epimyces CBS 606.96 TaxID=1182542 RepID=W9YC15_9EURO|nr:uncharacterized protein A1O3_03131 [Capronia epimyces CBS 606.96]EXJ90063.1 hypothetical protein A1O3_03131 [Capronia epimyces CBS 606.96]
MSLSRRYSRMRETLFDLYTERDALPWYFRTIALVASWLALGGYILFALVFTSAESNIKASRFTLTLLASVFLFVGYAVSAVIAFYCRSLLFAFDAVLLPILTSSFMGVFVTVMNHALHKEFPIPSQAYIYVPLVTASSTTVASAVLGYIAYRKMATVKSLDRQRRQHVPRWEKDSYASYGDAASTTELLPIHHHKIPIPEDEAQRQQFLRLLLERDPPHSPNIHSLSSTYQITLPGDEPGHQGSLVATPDGRPRSGSLPSKPRKWNIFNNVTRDRSPNLEGYQDSRERRRRQIERASVLLTPGSEGEWAQTPGASPPLVVDQPPPWTGSTRYA